MTQSHKIVLIIGNGFDLDLGLPTTYKDFYESEYCPKHYPSPLVHHLNQTLGNSLDKVRWYHLENELLNYYHKIQYPQTPYDVFSKEEAEILKTIKINKASSSSYDINNDTTIPNLFEKHTLSFYKEAPKTIKESIINDCLATSAWRDKKAVTLIKDGLCEYLKNLSYKKDSYSIAFQILNTLESEASHGIVDIFSFNYTLIFWGEPRYARFYYMHGNCTSKDIILGTRDSTQFNNNYDFLQKSFDPKYDPPFLVSKLLEANEIIIFGHSLGINDQQYLKAFFIKQTSYNDPIRKDITFFTKDDNSEIEMKRSLQLMTDGNLSSLYGLNNVKIIKTNNIKQDQHKPLSFLKKHGKSEEFAMDYIGKLLRCDSSCL